MRVAMARGGGEQARALRRRAGKSSAAAAAPARSSTAAQQERAEAWAARGAAQQDWTALRAAGEGGVVSTEGDAGGWEKEED